jgi:hypothetical protein
MRVCRRYGVNFHTASVNIFLHERRQNSVTTDFLLPLVNTRRREMFAIAQTELRFLFVERTSTATGTVVIGAQNYER